MNALKLLGKTFEQFLQDVVDEYNDCLRAEEDMQGPDWMWGQMYNILGAAYNAEKMSWVWCQKVLDRKITAGEYAHVLAVIDAKNKGIDVGADNPAAIAPDQR